MDHPTARLARTQSGDERRRRAQADVEAAAEEVRHAGLAAELAAAEAEIRSLRQATHGGGAGSEPLVEPATGIPALLGEVRSEGALLTLVCLSDGAAVPVPLAAAAAESELVRSMLEDPEDEKAGSVLEVGLGEGQAAAFAAFLRDPAAAAGGWRSHLLGEDSDDTEGFAALFGAAGFLMAPRWQQQLAEAWAAELLELVGRGGVGD